MKEEIYAKIIPKASREEREGFSNLGILMSLTKTQKVQLEKKLIDDVKFELDNTIKHVDYLKIDTLSNLGLPDGLVLLRKILFSKKLANEDKVYTAGSIYRNYEIEEVRDLLMDLIESLPNKRQLGVTFIQLLGVANSRLVEYARENVNSKDLSVKSAAMKYLESIKLNDSV